MGTGASYVAMVLVQLAYGGSNILIKISLEKGLNRLVFIVYRHLIAVLLLGPFAYVLEREQRPPFSIKVMAKIFVLSSLGTTIYLNVYYVGLEYTSATVATALSNPIPCLTFLIAVMLRMEELNTKKASGQAKIIGTLICLGGSLMFTFWKGGYLIRSLLKRPLISLHDPSQASDVSKHGKENWIKGSLLILTGDIAWSAWLIFQAVVYKAYPARLSLTVLICFFASLQSSVLSLFFARNRSLWKLEANVQLWTIIYCGVVLSALVYYLQTWCISREGPVFAAMFGPLVLVFVAIFSAVAFNERLHLSSLIAACIIVLGLYCVLWGKRKESLCNAQVENRKGVADRNTQEISVTTAK